MGFLDDVFDPTNLGNKPGRKSGGVLGDSGGAFGMGSGQTDAGGLTGLFDDTLGELFGNNAAAEAAQRAAEAREAQLARATATAKEGLADIQGRRGEVQSGIDASTGTARDSLSAAQGREAQQRQDILAAIQAAQSPQELAALETALSNQERVLQRQEQLMANLDPAIAEAADQVLSILQGGESQFLDPVRQERGRQRQDLVDMLREQMGPGAETSTAGAQALNQFDQQTNMLLSEQRQRSLDQVFGIANTGAQTSSQIGVQGAGAMAGIAQGFGNAAGRNAQARLGGLEAAIRGGAQTQNAFGDLFRTQMMGTELMMGQNRMEQQGFANVVNAQTGQAAASGSQFVGDALRAQGRQEWFDKQDEYVDTAIGAIGGTMASGGGKGK